jgi:hypothetical protein
LYVFLDWDLKRVLISAPFSLAKKDQVLIIVRCFLRRNRAKVLSK